jgi:hypothetical protein
MSIAIEARMNYAARGGNAIICVRESTFRGPHRENDVFRELAVLRRTV